MLRFNLNENKQQDQTAFFDDSMAKNNRFFSKINENNQKLFENREDKEESPSSPRSLASVSRFSSRDAEINGECLRERERERM